MAAMLLAAASAARADPGYYVVTAYPNEGERSIDFRYWTVKAPNQYATRWPEFGVGYGVNSRWYTELYASYIGSTDYPTQLNTLNWQNDVLLTQGQYPFDLAIHTTWTHYRDRSEGDDLELGPVLQTEIERTQFNANLFFEHSFGSDDSGPTDLRYQWQVKHRFLPTWAVGLQGFGELGPWNHWSPRDQQSHRAGPAFFGTLPLGAGQSLRYQAAYLFGTVYGGSAGMFSMRVQYAF
jgi:hypothetical protein